MPVSTGQKWNILHVLRAPVGGLFRHVVDLARGQAERGHAVGIVADGSTGGARADALFAELAPRLTLGISRIDMGRQIGPGDVAAVRHVRRRIAETSTAIVHGHGAKGGAYARLAACGDQLRVYTPHGGSLHYRWGTPAGMLYLSLECVLMRRTELFLFESAYGRDAYGAKIGHPNSLVRVVHNGVGEAEFVPVTPEQDASDLVFIGELRTLKGIDVLIEAVAALAAKGRPVSATIVGDGPDREALTARAEALKPAVSLRFTGALPARTAFAKGRILVVPSRAESLPYVVLEGAAAGLPVLATNVGGIPEIFADDAGRLIAPGDPAALERAIAAALDHPADTRAAAARLTTRVHTAFSVEAMTSAVLDAYADAFALRKG